jgi:hypothetical protein
MPRAILGAHHVKFGLNDDVKQRFSCAALALVTKPVDDARQDA